MSIYRGLHQPRSKTGRHSAYIVKTEVGENCNNHGRRRREERGAELWQAWGLPFPSRLVLDLTTPQTSPQATIWLHIVGCETSNLQQEQYSKIIFVLTDYFL